MNKDAIKEKLTWLRVWLTFLLAAVSGCIVWFINNLDNPKILLIYYDMGVIILLTSLLILINYEIIGDIKKLETEI